MSATEPSSDPIEAVLAPPPPNEIPHDEPDPADDNAFERASAAAHGLGDDARADTPPTPPPPIFGMEELLAILEMLYSTVTELTATSLGIVPDEKVRELGTISAIEKKLLTAFGPHALKNLDKLEAFLERFGALFFGGLVALGLLTRIRILKRFADQARAQRETGQAPSGGPS